MLIAFVILSLIERIDGKNENVNTALNRAFLASNCVICLTITFVDTNITARHATTKIEPDVKTPGAAL